jgi:hypothetical protein
MAKRKASSGFSSKRKRLIWITAIAVLVVIVVLYETNQEIRRQNNATGLESADAARVPAQKAQAELRSYYRSHELPTGWKAGDTDLIEPDRLEVTLFFAPRIGDSRHGQAAAPGDITAANACPVDEALRRRLEHFSLWIRVNDNTGLIDSFAC